MRFARGEIVKFVVSKSRRHAGWLGRECQVLLAPFPAGIRFDTGRRSRAGEFDYGVEFSDGLRIAVQDYQLQKLNPPPESEAMTREISMHDLKD